MNNYYNNFTKELDKYNIIFNKYKDCEYNSCWRTYLWDADVERAVQGKKTLIAFRVPGATRGHIEVDDNLIIKDIVFYEDVCFSNNLGCYVKNAKEIIPKFLGTKLEVEQYEKEKCTLETGA